MSANWTDDKNHFPAASTAASSDRGRNHTLHEVPLCRWCFIQRVFKKKHSRVRNVCTGATAISLRNGLIYQRGLWFSLWNSDVGISYQRSLQSHILFICLPPTPLLLPSRRHRLVLFGFLVQKSRHLSRQSWTTKIRQTLWRQWLVVREKARASLLA